MEPASRRLLLATPLAAIWLAGLPPQAVAQPGATAGHQAPGAPPLQTIMTANRADAFPDNRTISAIRSGQLAARGVQAQRDSAQTSQTQTSQERDAVWNGILIGAGVGALLGLIPDHYDDCEECHDSLYASIAVGAGIGLLVDLLHNRGQTASPSQNRDGLQMDVLVGRRAVGVGGRIAWR